MPREVIERHEHEPRPWLPAWCALALAVAGCTPASPELATYAEPGCRDAPGTVTVMVEGRAVTRQGRECQQPDGSWRSVSLEPDAPRPLPRRSGTKR